MIVLPALAHSRLHPPFAESVAHDLMHRASCPVLLVPLDSGDSQPPALTRILLAVDATTLPKRAVGAVSRAAVRGAEVIVLHVHEVDRPEAYEVDRRIDSVTAELQAADFQVVVIRSHALPHAVAEEIAEVAHYLGAGVIVLGGGGGGLLAGVLHGSLSGDVLGRAPCPVLVER